MKKIIVVFSIFLLMIFIGCKKETTQTPNPEPVTPQISPVVEAENNEINFFITSVGPGKGADLGGLEGADAHCQKLAEEIGSGSLTWHAYLSTTGENGVNAKDRIGNGPWFNAEGVKIATDVANLHGQNNLNKETALNEKGEKVNGKGDTPNRHDMLTGSKLDGSAIDSINDTTCSNWKSSTTGSARLGHHDRQGGGQDPTSWNSAHDSRGCSQEDLKSTGGDGLFYCFAVD